MRGVNKSHIIIYIRVNAPDVKDIHAPQFVLLNKRKLKSLSFDGLPCVLIYGSDRPTRLYFYGNFRFIIKCLPLVFASTQTFKSTIPADIHACRKPRNSCLFRFAQKTETKTRDPTARAKFGLRKVTTVIQETTLQKEMSPNIYIFLKILIRINSINETTSEI
jgi:hypothetical protein